MTEPGADARQQQRSTVLGLGALFGAMYFVQGIGEPTEGLIGQPVKSYLAGRGHDAGEIAIFSALLGLPWAIKPLYGILTDFAPIFGSCRRSYLLLATSATTFGLFGIFSFFTPDISRTSLLLALLIPQIGIAVADVVIDALMVEQGQRHGMTGRFQSIQWAAVYAAPIIAAPVGGYLAEHDQQRYGFLVCAVAALFSFALTVLFVREPPRPSRSPGLRHGFTVLRRAAATPGLPLVAGFLFLWNFNPFANDVLYVHLTAGLGLGEQIYGWTVSAMGASAVVASLAYGLYCRSVPFGRLLQISIAMGFVSAVCYLAVVGPKSAMAVAVIVGFTYMTGTLIQLDLVARICPAAVAGTIFAMLMSISNISLSWAIALGGQIYSAVGDRWGAERAFQIVVVTGAICSLSCGFFIQRLQKRVAESGL